MALVLLSSSRVRPSICPARPTVADTSVRAAFVSPPTDSEACLSASMASSPCLKAAFPQLEMVSAVVPDRHIDADGVGSKSLVSEVRLSAFLSRPFEVVSAVVLCVRNVVVTVGNVTFADVVAANADIPLSSTQYEIRRPC